MIWDLPMINQVRSLRTDMLLSEPEMVAAVQVEEVVQAATNTMLDKLLEGGHDLGVEIHPGDVHLQRWNEEDRDLVHFRMRWIPTTKEIELRGGASDGQRWEVYDINQGFEVMERHVQDPPMGDPPPRYATLRRVVYRLSGWNEEGRHWMFDRQD